MRSRKSGWLRKPVLWLVVILCLGALLRGVNLTLPPVDFHSWRQTETAAMARNYAEEGYRLFYPTVDWRGHTRGYVESELSIYAFTVALAYGLLGFNEMWARLLSIAVTALTGYTLYAIASRVWRARAGLLTALTFTFLSPFGLFFGQAIMGDMTVLLFVTTAVYAGLRWAEVKREQGGSEGTDGGWGWFLLMGMMVAAGALSKLPALYVAGPLVALVFIRDGPQMALKPRNWGLALATLGAIALWYAHAYRLGQQTGLTFGIWGSNKVGNFALLRNWGFYRALWFNLSHRILTVEGLLFAGLGLVLPRKSRFESALLVWLLSVLAYLLYAALGVLGQDYYTLAILPPLSLFAGKGLSWLYGRIVAWAASPSLRYRLVAGVLFGVWIALLGGAAFSTGESAFEMMRGFNHTWGFWEGGQWIQAATPRESGLVVVGGAPPEGLYFSHRHGIWYDDYALGRVQTADWPYALLLNPHYDPEVDLAELPAGWRLIGGGRWFLAYDLQGKVPTTPTHPLEERPQWGDAISLLGYDFIPARLVNGRLYLVLHWQADAPPPANPLVGFVHVWDGQGNFCGQDDHQPLRGELPTQRWEEGQVVLDAYEVELSGCDLASPELRVSVGLYRAVDVTRVPLTSWSSDDQLYWFSVDPARP